MPSKKPFHEREATNLFTVGTVLNRLSRSDLLVEDYKANESLCDKAQDIIHHIVGYQSHLKANESEFEIVFRDKKAEKYNKHIETLEEIKSLAEEIKKARRSYTVNGQDLHDFIMSVPDTNSQIRKQFEQESLSKTLDVQHRVVLTGLKTAQIFIFVFATYFAISAATGLLGYFNLNKDLVIPRGLITIVPNNLIQSAQNQTNRQKASINLSADTKAEKTLKVSPIVSHSKTQ